MIKHVFIDLDDTILDFKKAEHRAISLTLRELGLEDTEEMRELYSRINLSLWKSLERGEVTRDELRQKRFADFFKETGADISAKRGADIYENYLSQGHFFIDGAEQMLKSLYEKYDLYLASNGITAIQRGRLASADIRKYFKNIFVSEEVGFTKPDKRYFDACFARIPGFEREKAVIIGDSTSSDILGGINAGIRTVLFNPSGEEPAVKPDRQVRSLDGIEKVLAEM